MKKLLFGLFFLFAFSATSQKEVKITIGGEKVKFYGDELVQDSTGRTTYYALVNGYLDYYEIIQVDGEVIQYEHVYCPAKQIELGDVLYKDILDSKAILVLKTKDGEPEVMVDTWKMSNGEIVKMEYSDTTMKLWIPDEKKGKEVEKAIKKAS
ncbi:hypothetical protein K6119_03140 [Paracrocinitomix mangrovi]|uniref:hypothetical protein n=1 Tax=Paracrocinitomix mangrovi TaxID=2862509 RepID=UPI001C8DA746|nr:hypothetical protein [Paracrocinitomix mangrovi]UKN02515.1 hypothetical protein K6119_03140 [Paracrocinitomix mangrovi]